MLTGRFLVAVLSAAALATTAACSSSGGQKSPVASSAAQPPFSLGLDFDPTPPKVGDEHFTVTVRDGSGAPVTGVKVSILPSFEAVPGGHLVAKTGMGGVSPTLATTDGGDGTYKAEMTLPKPIYWTFTVQAAIGDTQMTLQRSVQVQQ